MSTSLAVEKLVIARHGDYKSDGHLSEQGRGDVEMLAGQIRTFMGTEYVQNGVTLVLSSESDRARETADIISSLLGLTCISNHALGDENGKAYMGTWVAEQLASFLNSYQGIIAVTHQDQVDYLPAHMHPNVRGGQGKLPYAWAHGFDQAGNRFGLSPEQIYPPKRMR